MKQKKYFLRKRKTGLQMLEIIMAIAMLLSVTGLGVQGKEPEDVSIQMHLSEKKAKGVETLLYSIALLEEDRTLAYQNDFKNSGISVEDIHWDHAREVKDLAETIVSYAETKNIAGLSVGADASGDIVYDHLKPGIYVITQRKENAQKTGIEMQSLLLEVPYYDADGNLVYQAEIEPKYEIIVSTPTPKPTDKPVITPAGTSGNSSYGGSAAASGSNVKAGIKTGDPGVWLIYAILALAAAGIGASVVFIAVRKKK